MTKYTQLSLFDNDVSNDSRPVPLRTADECGFPLTYVDKTGNPDDYLYCARDWYMGLGGDKSRWSKSKSDWLAAGQPVKIEVKRERRKPELMEFVSEEWLYRIATRMPSAEDRPQLDKVKNHLAKCGVDLAKYMRNPKARAEFGATAGADAVIDAVIGDYKKKGKSNSWIQERLEGIDARKRFASALANSIVDLTDDIYWKTTEKIYATLWKRTTAQLRGELNLTKIENLRDNFGEFALHYTKITEAIISRKLEGSDEITQSVAMEIVWEVAKVIQHQINSTSQLLGIDLVTEKPLLKGENS